MSGAMRKVAVYLGLVEDQDRDDYDSAYDGEYDGERADGYEDRDGYDRGESRPARGNREEPAGAVRSYAGASPGTVPGGTGATVAAFPDRRAVRGARTNGSAAPGTVRETPKITTVHPRTFNDARTIGEHFRDGTPVIMNLTEIDDSDARRLVDFAAGLIFGLRGSIDRVTSKVFLLSPGDVTVTAEDRAKIAEGGFFNQS